MLFKNLSVAQLYSGASSWYGSLLEAEDDGLRGPFVCSAQQTSVQEAKNEKRHSVNLVMCSNASADLMRDYGMGPHLSPQLFQPELLRIG
jgi:hypothetical protein